MPASFRRRQNVGVSFIREIARLAWCPMECREAVELLKAAEALAGYAPRIIPTECSTAETTLISIPSLMVGQRRMVRFRLMRGYIRSIQKDVSTRLQYQVDTLARNGQWDSVYTLFRLRLGARIAVALLFACGILFLVRIPARSNRRVPCFVGCCSVPPTGSNRVQGCRPDIRASRSSPSRAIGNCCAGNHEPGSGARHERAGVRLRAS